MPVLANDRRVGRAEDESQRDRRDDRVIERPDDRYELRDEIDRRCEPHARDADDDLRGKTDAPVAQKSSEKPDQIREQKSELARENDPTDDHEHHDHDDPDPYENEKDVGPGRQVHAG